MWADSMVCRSEHEPREASQKHCNSECALLDADREWREEGDRARYNPLNRRQREQREKHCDERAQKRECKGFGNQLSHETRARCTDGESYRDLPRTADAAKTARVPRLERGGKR
jgi:hypothetical protein